MPSPPRSLDEAVNRIARALADDDGDGWWGEEECGPGHVDAARRLAEAAGVSVLLERLQEVERERDARERTRTWALEQMEEAETRAESAEARVASLEQERDAWATSYAEVIAEVCAAIMLGVDPRSLVVKLQRISSALAQGAAAPLPGDTG